jgi:hypothetical protein
VVRAFTDGGKIANGHDAHANAHDQRRQISIADALRIVRRGDGEPIAIAMAWAALAKRIFPAHEQVGPADPNDPNSPSLLKIPYIQGWQKKATTDLTQIERWWKKHPNALIATPSDEDWLLDCDNPAKHRDAQGNPCGRDGIGNAERLFGPLDELSSYRFLSPSDGINVVFKRQPGEHPIQDASLIAPGIDTRGLVQDDATKAAGLFILPGSVRSDGKRWHWCDDVPDDFDPRQASHAPEAVIREASLTKHMRDLMDADPGLKATISEAQPTDIRRIINDYVAAHRPKPSGPLPELKDADAKRHRAIAMVGIAGDAATLEVLPAGGSNGKSRRSGRDNNAYARACRWAPYIGAGIITEAELVEPLMHAQRQRLYQEGRRTGGASNHKECDQRLP